MIWLIIIGGNMELNLKKQINSRKRGKLEVATKYIVVVS
jgi:hypothetical protein